MDEKLKPIGWRAWLDKSQTNSSSAGLTFIDLFAGCGGLALGFVSEGFDPITAVEWDLKAAETYRLNIDDRIQVEDIARVTDFPTTDVLVGGPPCQGFSQLGARDADDPRNRLWQEYVRVLVQSKAKVFVMENVPQLLRSIQFELFLAQVTNLGFSVSSRVLCAADYGVPQMRRRAIVIGSKLGEPFFPEKTHGPESHAGVPYETLRRAFLERPALAVEPDGANWHKARPNIRPTSVTRYRAVPGNGGDRFQMQAALDAAHLGDLVPACWRRKRSGTTDVFGRLWWDRPAVTIRTEFFKPEKGRYLHPVADRPITVREAARLQTFPDTFVFPEGQSMIDVAKQLGNAVPPKLAAAVARAIVDHIRTHDAAPFSGLNGGDVRQLELVV
jgi:DNA (cytosine-5)-methyltransferase 1